MATTKFLDYTGLSKLVEKIKNTFIKYDSGSTQMSIGGGVKIQKVTMTDGTITNTLKSQNIGITRGVGSNYQSGIYGMFNGATKDRNTQFFLTHRNDETLSDNTKISFPQLWIKDTYANGKVRNQLYAGYDKLKFESKQDSLYMEMNYCDADDGNANYGVRVTPGKYQATHYTNGVVDRYILWTYKGITKNDGKDTEVFNTNGGTVDLTTKVDTTDVLTDSDINEIWKKYHTTT